MEPICTRVLSPIRRDRISVRAINVLTDAFVVLLPIPIIWKMNMAFASKIRASALFGIGIMYKFAM